MNEVLPFERLPAAMQLQSDVKPVLLLDDEDSTHDNDVSTVDDTEGDDEDPQENVPQSEREEVTYCRI